MYIIYIYYNIIYIYIYHIYIYIHTNVYIYMYIHWVSTIHMNKKNWFWLDSSPYVTFAFPHVLPITYGTFTEHSIGLNPWAPPHPMKYPIHKYHTYLDISMLSHYPIRYPIYPIYTIYIYTPYNSHICIYIYIPDTINLLHLRLYSTCSLPHRYRSPWRTLRDAFDCAAPTCRASRSAPRGNWPSCRRRVGWGFPVKLWVYQRIGF